jgi:hypothetical protein
METIIRNWIAQAVRDAGICSRGIRAAGQGTISLGARLRCAICVNGQFGVRRSAGSFP